MNYTSRVTLAIFSPHRLSFFFLSFTCRARSLYLFQWNSGWIIDSVIAIGETAARWGLRLARDRDLIAWMIKDAATRDVERHGGCTGPPFAGKYSDCLRRSSSPLLLILNAPSNRRNADGTEMNSENSENLGVYHARINEVLFQI